MLRLHQLISRNAVGLSEVIGNLYRVMRDFLLLRRGQCAKRRAAEARLSAERAGVMELVLDNHDGELQPTLALRKRVVEIIREFKGSGKFPFVPKGGDFVYWGIQHRVEKVVWSFPDREDHSLIRADVLLA